MLPHILTCPKSCPSFIEVKPKKSRKNRSKFLWDCCFKRKYIPHNGQGLYLHPLVTRGRFVCIFNFLWEIENRCSSQCAHWLLQQSTGLLLVNGSNLLWAAKKPMSGWGWYLEVTRQRFVCIFNFLWEIENKCSSQCAHWLLQQSTGLLLVNGSNLLWTAKKPMSRWTLAFLVTRRRFELRTHCLKGNCSAN